MILRRLFIGALMIASFSFAACSGAGNTVPPSPPAPTPTAAQSLKLSGTMVQTYTYRYGFPSPQPPLTVVTKIDQDVSATSGSAPAGYPRGSNLIVRVNETDKANLSKHASTTIAYVAYQASKDLLYASSTRIDAAGGAQSSISTTKYAAPRLITETGRATWSNSPARTIDETFSDGHDERRTVAADGTYVEDGTAMAYYGALANTKLYDRSSGAGSYSGPFLGCPPGTRFSFAAPSGTPLKILVALKSANPNCTFQPGTFPAWFQTSPTFYTETDGSKPRKMPSSCGAGKGHPANDVGSAIAFLDTIVGYVELTQTDAYSTARGLQCVVYRDTMLMYYDWQGDTP